MDFTEVMRKPTEEVLTPQDLENLFSQVKRPGHYIGFEISGLIHLGTGIVSALKIADLQKAGVKTRVFLADWHTWINDKLGGDREFIREVAVEYFGPLMRKCVDAVGGDGEEVELVLGTELYDNGYWERVIDVAKHVTLARAMRSVDILGRKAGEGIDMAKLIYPLMQVADIYQIGAHIAHAGLDQRKAHVVARMVAPKLKNNPLGRTPVALHHHMILGLHKPPKIPESEEEKKRMIQEIKMSKSVPKSAVFVHDSEEEIRKKLRKAFCPPTDQYNPILDWIEWFLLRFGPLEVKKTYEDYESLREDFLAGKIHPLDLKEAVAERLIEILRPLRRWGERREELIGEIRARTTR